jgi:hypothetical protein
MWYAHFTQFNKYLLLQNIKAFLYICVYARNDGVYVKLDHGRLTFLWQRATPVIVGWFAGRMWKINIIMPATACNRSLS